MTERAYTVSEIAALRKACENEYLYGRALPRYMIVKDDSGRVVRKELSSRPYKVLEKNSAVERRVRTYMMAGITAEDMIEDCRREDAALAAASVISRMQRA